MAKSSAKLPGIGRIAAGAGTAAALALAGCTLGPNFTPPKAPPETTYTSHGAAEKQAGDQHFALGAKITGDWWTLFRSDPLDAVLKQAVAGNRSLVAAQATLAAAQESVNAALAGLYPQVDLGASAVRQHINGAQFGLPELPPQFPPYSNLFRVGPTVSYALDIFGGTRRTIEESAALAAVQDYQLDAAYLTLTGNAVLQALTIASLRAQLDTVDGIVADDQRNLDLVHTELRAGVATQLDIETATSQLATDRTLRPPLLQQLSVARHALTVLVGKVPSNWQPPNFDLDRITLPTELPLSLPSSLVRQRPDLLAAEAQLHAASAAIGVATAQLYPQITLTGAMSQQAISLDTLFHGASNVWSLGPSLTMPIFHAGALEAERRRAVDNFNAALATYEQTVLQAFGQVADVLEALNHDAELLAEEQSALRSAQSSLDLTRRSYSIGSVGILQVVDAQRVAEQARLGFVRAKVQRYLDTAQLFVAMGGGWWSWRANAAAPAAAMPVSAPAR
ncbi:MAG TPA: efflux transporter outer membrane subunit [Stellaceae bacterium]|nr:efflux transporter outer membrane subunit [Stellaceae bacterium]